MDTHRGRALRELGLECLPASGGRDLEDAAEIGLVVGTPRAAADHLRKIRGRRNNRVGQLRKLRFLESTSLYSM